MTTYVAMRKLLFLSSNTALFFSSLVARTYNHFKLLQTESI